MDVKTGFALKWIICLMLVGLTAGCGAPGLQITGITHDPEVPGKGEQMAFTIAYRNANSSSSYEDVVVEITRFDPGLIFRGTDPKSESGNADQGIRWYLGSLSSNQEGKVIAYFELGKDIPPDQYSLSVEAKISGKDSQGNGSSSSSQGVTNILENPTPTPSVFVYEAQGVTLEIPWQGYDVVVEQRDFNLDYPTTPTPLPTDTTAYDIIRPLIYVQVLRIDASHEKTLLNHFNPPLRVTARYTPADIDAVGGDPNKLTLMVLDHKSGIWQPYTTTIDASSRTGTISVTDWTSHLSWARPR